MGGSSRLGGLNLALGMLNVPTLSVLPSSTPEYLRATRNHQQRQVEPGLHDQGPGMLATESPRVVAVRPERIREAVRYSGLSLMAARICTMRLNSERRASEMGRRFGCF